MSAATFTVGGSEAAAACGVDPYQSRVMLWARKTGKIPPTPENEAMRWGKLLKGVILGVLEMDHGFEFLPSYVMTAEPGGALEYSDRECPWMIGHPDAFAVKDGRTYVIDAKTAGPWIQHSWDDGDAPTAYICQLQHYMHLTRCDVGLLACLVAGQRLHLRTVERDEKIIELLLQGEEEFVGFCERDEPPPPAGAESDSDALRAMFPGEQGKRVKLDRTQMALVHELRLRERAYQNCKRQRDEAKQAVQLVMGDAEVAVNLADEVVCRWTTYERQGKPARRFTVA